MIDKCIIGAILKETIKRRGFTQGEFAQITGIGLSTLKKYIAGTFTYSVETLDIIADTLQCSYDYLLGKSLTPEKELHDMKSATKLSDSALQVISDYAKSYDTKRESRRYIDTLSNLIQSNFIIERIIDYFYINNSGELIFDENESENLFVKSIWVGNEPLTPPDIEDAYLLGIIRALEEAKPLIGTNVPQKLRNYKTKKYN
jgi:transcriptional regulator with XRE-family HTH domain